MGTPEQIQTARIRLEQAEGAVVYEKLRLRVLLDEAMMQQGDSFNVQHVIEASAEIGREFDMSKVRAF